LRYILETPPGLADTPWQAQYEELLTRTGFLARP
jgi:hypothetical protein